MYTIIRSKVVNVPLTSVTLGIDPNDTNSTQLHMFFCLNCGTPVGQYKGFVYTVIPGGAQMPLPWIQRCDTCKRKYAIQGIL